MAGFPTRHTVRHHVHSDGPADANNRRAAVYTPPRDQPGTPVPVIGWEIPKSAEPAGARGADRVARHDQRVVVDVKLYAPPQFRPAPRDLVDVPGIGVCEVLGIAETADGNPFGWNPGSIVNLRRATG